MSRKKSNATAAKRASQISAIPETNPKVELVIAYGTPGEEDGVKKETLMFELMFDKVPKTADNFKQLVTGVQSADKKNSRLLTYCKTPIFRATDFMIQGGDVTNTIETQPTSTSYKGQESVNGGLFDDERVWDTFENMNAFPTDETATCDAKDIDALKKTCLEKGYGGFSVSPAGVAAFKKRSAEECCGALESSQNTFYSHSFGPSSLRHQTKGVLSMVNSGPDTNGSQFFVTTRPAGWLDGRHTAFGKLVSGDLDIFHQHILQHSDEDGFTEDPKICYIDSCSLVETVPKGESPQPPP
eukprot:TRINITY_DN11121_c0_g1_i2.p1 TRINITY_DN11121_c0_g1~~TRINITY_DN11121_c0_g1_i2.p1  ORF type:complete len:299 (+),score=64.56 TRINITY_DN11121_c0_g1_i2:53-949(+)